MNVYSNGTTRGSEHGWSLGIKACLLILEGLGLGKDQRNRREKAVKQEAIVATPLRKGDQSSWLASSIAMGDKPRYARVCLLGLLFAFLSVSLLVFRRSAQARRLFVQHHSPDAQPLRMLEEQGVGLNSIRSPAEGYNVAMVTLCRNAGTDLEPTLRSLTALGDIFRLCKLIVLENDSSDSTGSRLDQLAGSAAFPNLEVHHPTITIVGDEAERSGRHGPRLYRMAALRNAARAYMMAQPWYSTLDYVIVVDCDLAFLPSSYSLQYSFERTSFDVLCANGINWHTYVIGDLTYYDDFAYVDADGRRVPESKTCKDKDTEICQFAFDYRKPELVPVRSCFGGLAVYRVEIMTDCEYDGHTCEHIALHECARAKGYDAIMVDTQLLVLR